MRVWHARDVRHVEYELQRDKQQALEREQQAQAALVAARVQEAASEEVGDSVTRISRYQAISVLAHAGPCMHACNINACYGACM